MQHELSYQGPIFDAHLHMASQEALHTLIAVENDFGVDKGLLIVHGDENQQYVCEKYPDRYVFAKYFSGTLPFREGFKYIADGIRDMDPGCYQVAKMQSAPKVRNRVESNITSLRLDVDGSEPMFEALAETNTPFLLHLSDPDTYYRIHYSDRTKFRTKEEDLQELEAVIRNNPDVQFQLAHFAAQPEIHRLDNLARWFDTYPNFYVDTGSARWMCRELSKDVDRAKSFLEAYSDRVLFGTDCVARDTNRDYFEGRHLSLRLLLESDVRDVKLPFPDPDTADSGGTYINGLSLSQETLENIYWKNANRLYGRFIEQGET
ncbi:MAG: amidohydrolase family protein [Candidatus Lokiarchaeota archaeon]|nr:amidohydrolase family protein [Candidatus Lokiarchaeota archaeon]